MNNQLRELLADFVHVAWSDWMEFLFRQSILNMDYSVTIPKGLVNHLKRQCATAYKDLPEGEKNFSRHEADRILRIIKQCDIHPQTSFAR